MNKVCLPRLKQLDGLRFFAIITIILSHLEFLKESKVGNVYWNHFHNATWGVDYFFILSGFGLFYSLRNTGVSNSLKNNLLFAIKKVKKIYVLYVISLIISLPYNIFLTEYSVKTVMIKFFINLTLLQSIFGVTRLSHGINGVCWFLSTLFICYFFAPVIIKFIRKKIETTKQTLFALFINIVLILAMSELLLMIQHKIDIFDDLFYGSPYIRILYLSLGMLLANLYFQIKDLIKASKFTTYELLISLLLIIFYLIRNILYVDEIFLRFFDVSLCSAGLLVFSFGKGCISSFLGSNKIVQIYGGGYGMYLYLLHYPVRMTIDLFLRKFFIINDYIAILESILILAMTFFCSYLFKLILEGSCEYTKKIK